MKLKLKAKLEDIDGIQIVDFIKKNLDSGCEFTSQVINKGYKNGKDTYMLDFTTQWNNWGHYSDCDNTLYISENAIEVCFDEPLEGNGDDEVWEEKLAEWLENYDFVKIDYKAKFVNIMSEIIEMANKASTPEDIEFIEGKLDTAKTYLWIN